jgi:hypothetical protein
VVGSFHHLKELYLHLCTCTLNGVIQSYFHVLPYLPDLHILTIGYQSAIRIQMNCNDVIQIHAPKLSTLIIRNSKIKNENLNILFHHFVCLDTIELINCQFFSMQFFAHIQQLKQQMKQKQRNINIQLMIQD